MYPFNRETSTKWTFKEWMFFAEQVARCLMVIGIFERRNLGQPFIKAISRKEVAKEQD